MRIEEIMAVSPVIPVVAIPDNVDPVKLAQALQHGGINIIEVVLRTASAHQAIEAICSKVSGMCAGAGTVWTAEDANRVIDAGVKFIVSPAYSAPVHDVCKARDISYLPGVQTVTEAARCFEAGISALKFFPANIAGGPGAIKAITSVLPEVTFCPTGGVNQDSAPGYLSLPNVPCVGGSWVLDKEDLVNEDWMAVNAKVLEAFKALKS